VKRRVYAALLSLAVLLLVSSVAAAGPAMDTVKAKQTQLFELLAKDNPDQKKISAIFDEMLDYSALAEASMGAEWKSLTPDQQKQFSDLLKQLVQQAYERNLKKTLSFAVDYVGEDALENKTFLVKTKAKDKNDKRAEPIEINFKLTNRDGKFKIVDIITEEVSLVDSYRAQFTKVYKKDGFDGLVTKMKDKIAKGS
jgi:phospholipid transport system substrate-binding protein